MVARALVPTLLVKVPRRRRFDSSVKSPKSHSFALVLEERRVTNGSRLIDLELCRTVGVSRLSPDVNKTKGPKRVSEMLGDTVVRSSYCLSQQGCPVHVLQHLWGVYFSVSFFRTLSKVTVDTVAMMVNTSLVVFSFPILISESREICVALQ